MSNRAARRAAQRQAFQNACQAPEQETATATPQSETPKPQPSAARVAANRENAQKSTGAKTPQGRAISSLNALKTGLTGVTVLLPNDDATAYQTHIADYETFYQPVGPEERAFVQSIADLRWRLNRIPALEMALIAIGYSKLAETDERFNGSDMTPILELEIRRAYEKEFRNLQLQEHRLSRRREKETAALDKLQQQRKEREAEELQQATEAYKSAQKQNQPFSLAALGFEFSKQRFIMHLARLTPPIHYQETPATTAETMQATA